MSLRASGSDCMTPNTKCNALKIVLARLEVHSNFTKSVRQVRHDKEIKSVVSVLTCPVSVLLTTGGR